MSSSFRDHPPESTRHHQVEAPALRRVPGSVMYQAGETRVLCTAIFEEGVPPFLQGKNQGWATAEYDLLPGSTVPRRSRERGGKLSGRTQEIQRLIGRTMRAALDLTAFPGFTLKFDCDVIEADGGTRTAAVSGAWIAAVRALAALGESDHIRHQPLRRQIAALSVGLLEGKILLDLNYEEDFRADVDLNVVMDRSGLLIEIQGTAEGEPFSQKELGRMIELVSGALESVFELQLTGCGDSYSSLKRY